MKKTMTLSTSKLRNPLCPQPLANHVAAHPTSVSMMCSAEGDEVSHVHSRWADTDTDHDSVSTGSPKRRSSSGGSGGGSLFAMFEEGDGTPATAELASPLAQLPAEGLGSTGTSAASSSNASDTTAATPTTAESAGAAAASGGAGGGAGVTGAAGSGKPVVYNHAKVSCPASQENLELGVRYVVCGLCHAMYSPPQHNSLRCCPSTGVARRGHRAGVPPWRTPMLPSCEEAVAASLLSLACTMATMASKHPSTYTRITRVCFPWYMTPARTDHTQRPPHPPPIRYLAKRLHEVTLVAAKNADMYLRSALVDAFRSVDDEILSGGEQQQQQQQKLVCL